MKSRAPGFGVIFVIGMPRSSTSIVHRTLADHPDIFSPTLSESLFPSDSITDTSLRFLFEKIPQSLFDKVYKPEIHRTGPTLPEAIDVALFKKFKRGVLAWVHNDALNNVEHPKFNKEEDLSYLKEIIRGWQRKYGDKQVCVKYFHGTLHLEELRENFPQAKFIMPLRNPETLVYSSATLLSMVMAFRKKRPTQDYWHNIYNNIVYSYNAIAGILKEENDDVYVIHEENLKADFKKEMSKIYSYLKVDSQNLEHINKYSRKYAYSNEMNALYNKDDFEGYFNLTGQVQHAS